MWKWVCSCGGSNYSESSEKATEDGTLHMRAVHGVLPGELLVIAELTVADDETLVEETLAAETLALDENAAALGVTTDVLAALQETAREDWGL